MRTNLKKYWTFLPICFFGYLFIKSYNGIFYETFIFDVEILVILGSLFFLFITIYKDYNIFQKEHKLYNLSGSIIGFLLIIFFFTIKFNGENLDNSPIILQAGYDGGYNGAWFEFREDGTYKFGNSSGLGATYSRGKYILKGSNIILDVNQIDNVILSNKFIIRNDSLINVDNDDKVISKVFTFQIHSDKR